MTFRAGRNIVINIYDGPCRGETAVALEFWVRNYPGQKITLVGGNMLLITDTQKCKLSIQPIDAKGNPAVVDGVPTWSVADPTILGVVAADDGLSVEISALGPLGATQVNVQADADLGPGTAPISGTLDVQVGASQAVALNIASGAPEAQ